MGDDLEEMFSFETFEAGGRALFAGMQDDRDPADVAAMVIELCRLQDRMDRLHRLSSRDDAEWGRLLPVKGREGEWVLMIGAVLAEQRNTETTFKQYAAEISRRRALYDDDDADEAGGLADL